MRTYTRIFLTIWNFPTRTSNQPIVSHEATEAKTEHGQGGFIEADNYPAIIADHEASLQGRDGGEPRESNDHSGGTPTEGLSKVRVVDWRMLVSINERLSLDGKFVIVLLIR